MQSLRPASPTLPNYKNISLAETRIPVTTPKTNASSGNTNPVQQVPIAERYAEEEVSQATKDTGVCLASSVCVASPTIGALVFANPWAMTHLAPLAIAGATVNGVRVACCPTRNIPENHPFNDLCCVYCPQLRNSLN